MRDQKNRSTKERHSIYAARYRGVLIVRVLGALQSEGKTGKIKRREIT